MGPKCHSSTREIFSLPEHTHNHGNHSGKHSIPNTLPIGDRFFNFESSQSGISPFHHDKLSPSNNSFLFGDHDDSTTTSGSYVLDPDDDFMGIVQNGRQCIV